MGVRRRVGLIGWPAGHSLSPVMQQAAFEALGMDWLYELLPVPPEALPDAVAALRGGEWRGANVTVPHKRAVIDHLDAIDGAPPLCPLADGEQTLRVNLGVLASAESQAWVTI